MSDTGNGAVGCLSRIRSHLFCSCKLLTHPPDHEEEDGLPRRVESVTVEAKVLETEKKMTFSPGIVARLMGLDSMPDPNWVPKERTVESVRRSRSVNSIDYWSEFDPVHRRVRTSWSFHDIPTFLQIDENEFVLVRSQTVCERRDRKTEMDTKERRKKTEVVTAKKEKKGKQVCGKVARNENCSRGSVTARTTGNASTSKINECRKPATLSRGKTTPLEVSKQRRVHNRDKITKKKIPPQCNSEKNLRVKQKANLPVKEISRLRSGNSRAPDFVKSVNKEGRKRREQHRRSTKSGWYLKVGISEEDIKSLVWKPREMWKLVHVEEIAIEFGIRILDRLVHEVVAELSGLPVENLGLLIMED